MARKVPVVREMRWLYVLPQLASLLTAVGVGIALAGFPAGPLAGTATYLAYSFGSRAILARDHKAGVRHFMRREWAKALPFFERSQAFFERHAWLDRYRPIFLMSPSAASYHEMALVNQAACLVNLDRHAEARSLYERTLELYPDSPIAESAMKVLGKVA